MTKGQASPKRQDSYSAERAPVARQIVTRANQSTTEFGPIFQAFGMDGGIDRDKIQRNMAARCDATPGVEAQREALRKASEFKKYEFDANGLEMNQRYNLDAVLTDGETPPAPPAPRAHPQFLSILAEYPRRRPPEGFCVLHAKTRDKRNARNALDLTDAPHPRTAGPPGPGFPSPCHTAFTLPINKRHNRRLEPDARCHNRPHVKQE